MNAYNPVVRTDRSNTRRSLFSALRGWQSCRRPDGSSICTQVDCHHWQVDMSLGCPRPYRNRMVGSDAVSRQRSRRRVLVAPLLVDIAYPCRKKHCEQCMKNRANQWGARACEEYRSNARTWLVTFTMSPMEHTLLEAEAMKRFREKFPNEERPDQNLALKLQCQVFQQRVKAWLDYLKKKRKRAGQNTDRAIRYFLVAEVHNSARTSEFMRGRPHFHMLLHEKEIGSLILDEECQWVGASTVVAERSEPEGRPEGRPLGTRNPPTYRVRVESDLRRAWQFGLSELKLALTEEGVYYLCKYLHKAPMYRAVASVGYGKKPSLEGPPSGRKVDDLKNDGEYLDTPQGLTGNLNNGDKIPIPPVGGL